MLILECFSLFFLICFYIFFENFKHSYRYFLLCSAHSFPQFLDISLKSVAFLKIFCFFFFSFKKNNLHSILCCIYNHGCEVISCSVLYLSGAEHIKENIFPSLEPTNCQNSSTDRGGPAQQLLTPYPCWTLTNGSSVGHAQELQQPCVHQCSSVRKALGKPFFIIGRRNLLSFFCAKLQTKYIPESH